MPHPENLIRSTIVELIVTAIAAIPAVAERWIWMKTKLLILVVLLSALCIVMASASMLVPASDRAREVSQAPEHSPVIGESFAVERVDFIHYVKPPSAAAKPKADTCYKLLGVKWLATPVQYTVNPANTEGLEDGSVFAAISDSAETWDAATSRELFGSYTASSSAYYGTYDRINAISFGPMRDDNVIAVTSIWYSRVGKQIVEFDILFNDYFDWGDGYADSTKMDLQNIATHELGHAVGMGDVYSTTCSAVTMYGYSEEGDTEKRTLEPPDIAGLQSLYGA